MQVYYDWIEWIKHEKRSPALSRTQRGAGVAKLLAIGKHGSPKFKTPKCLVRKVPRYTSLATLAFLCQHSHTGYESMTELPQSILAHLALCWPKSYRCMYTYSAKKIRNSAHTHKYLQVTGNEYLMNIVKFLPRNTLVQF